MTTPRKLFFRVLTDRYIYHTHIQFRGPLASAITGYLCSWTGALLLNSSLFINGQFIPARTIRAILFVGVEP